MGVVPSYNFAYNRNILFEKALKLNYRTILLGGTCYEALALQAAAINAPKTDPNWISFMDKHSLQLEEVVNYNGKHFKVTETGLKLLPNRSARRTAAATSH